MVKEHKRRPYFWIGVVWGIIGAVVVFLFLGDDEPTKEDPAAYTRQVVQQVIDRYERDGMEATLSFVNSTASVDGPWYPFIINEDGYTIGHHNPRFRNREPSERVDPTGYFYGDDLLAATEDGIWVSYVILNPDTGEEQRKHTWAVLHDGWIFGSGWYE